jgi:hypothetical protein
MTSAKDFSGPSDRWFHPLIGRPEPGMSRRRLLLLSGAGVVAVTAARPELRLVAAQTPEASPDAMGTAFQDQITGDEDAVALLRSASQAMADLDTFSFLIDTTRGESTIFQGLSVDQIEGAVRRPIDFTATVTVGLPIGSISVTAVGVDGVAMVQDPTSDGKWITLEGAEDITSLINPDSLILASIGVIKNAAIDGTERVDGVDTTVISGEVNFKETAEALSDGPVTFPEEITSDSLPVLIWIDQDNLVHEIEVSGPIISSESDDVVRSIQFFDFNQPVDIETPTT